MTEYFYKIRVETEDGDYNFDGEWEPTYRDKIVCIEDIGEKDFSLSKVLYDLGFEFNLEPGSKIEYLGNDLSIKIDIFR